MYVVGVSHACVMCLSPEVVCLVCVWFVPVCVCVCVCSVCVVCVCVCTMCVH